jgi:hypothetical protein
VVGEKDPIENFHMGEPLALKRWSPCPYQIYVLSKHYGVLGIHCKYFKRYFFKYKETMFSVPLIREIGGRWHPSSEVVLFGNAKGVGGWGSKNYSGSIRL